MPIVAGIVLAAVGDELVIAHPGHHAELFDAFTIVGGPAVYLARAPAVPVPDGAQHEPAVAVALAALAALTVAGAAFGVPLLALAVAATLVLAALLVHDARRRRVTEQQQSS